MCYLEDQEPSGGGWMWGIIVIVILMWLLSYAA
jgi:hypothetical protein